MSKNLVVLIGRVGKDPEIKRSDSGKTIATFSFVTSEKYTDKNGEKIENSQWHNIVIWGKLAEVVEKYVKKGDQLSIDGKINYRTYDDKDGNKKYITEIICNELIMLGGKREAKQSDNIPYEN